MSDYYMGRYVMTDAQGSQASFRNAAFFNAAARRWFVLNRRVWWNREPCWAFAASSDAIAADILIALSARKS
jgi:hypothetical protein